MYASKKTERAHSRVEMKSAPRGKSSGSARKVAQTPIDPGTRDE